MISEVNKMSIKVIIVLCFGVLAVQGKPRHAEVTGALDTVIEKLKKLEEQVTKASQSAINTVNEDFENMSDAIASISEISYLAHDLSGGYVDSVEFLKNESIKRGVDNSECIGDSPAIIKQLPEDLLSNVSNCYNPKYEKAQNFMEEVKNEVNETLSSVQRHWNEIAECQDESGQEQQTCISEISAEITNDSQTIPMKIASLLETVTDYITDLKTDLFHCYDDRIFEYRDELQNILASVLKCTMDKWSSSITTSTTSIVMN